MLSFCLRTKLFRLSSSIICSFFSAARSKSLFPSSMTGKNLSKAAKPGRITGKAKRPKFILSRQTKAMMKHVNRVTGCLKPLKVFAKANVPTVIWMRMQPIRPIMTKSLVMRKWRKRNVRYMFVWTRRTILHAVSLSCRQNVYFRMWTV